MSFDITKRKLLISAVIKFVIGFVAVALMIFLPAGTMYYRNGWLLMGILFVPIFLAGVVLYCKNPQLLAKRLNHKEKDRSQDALVKASGAVFILGFLICGLGVRFGWYQLPLAATLIGVVVFLIGYALYAEVLRENSYLSRTVEVQKGQTVIDSGLYSLVRHPMYLSTLLIFLSIPIILGSIYSFAVFLIYPIIIKNRILKEEAYLLSNLSGYSEYCLKTKYRLLPFIW